MRSRGKPALLALVITAGCAHHHQAKVAPAPVPPPSADRVTHSSPLWVELEGLPERQCTKPRGERALCFAGLKEALGQSLERTLWPSFPRVQIKRKGDNVMPGDYLLHVTLAVEPLPPDESGPGWSAAARGEWRLVRDGLPLASEAVSSRSRADFPYGRSLGAGAEEVLGAIAVHTARVIGELPELRPELGVPLPPVVSERRAGPLFTAARVEAQSSEDAKRCSMASR